MLPSTSTRRLFPVGRQTKEDMREERSGERVRDCCHVVTHSHTCLLLASIHGNHCSVIHGSLPGMAMSPFVDGSRVGVRVCLRKSCGRFVLPG